MNKAHTAGALAMPAHYSPVGQDELCYLCGGAPAGGLQQTAIAALELLAQISPMQVVRGIIGGFSITISVGWDLTEIGDRLAVTAPLLGILIGSISFGWDTLIT